MHMYIHLYFTEKIPNKSMTIITILIYSSLNPAGAQHYSNAHFGEGIGPIQLHAVHCSGSEQQLLDCFYLKSNNCVHSDDAGVACNGESFIKGQF